MYAVIRTGGKQHRVQHNDRLVVERLAASPGDMVALDDVLMLGGDGAPSVGGAVPDTARVFAEVLEQRKGRKVIVFKKKRRKNHRRLNGHRQLETLLRITGISATGERPADATPADETAEAPPVSAAAPTEAAPADLTPTDPAPADPTKE
jgi:large subunit ribosomal protein L21